MDNKKRVLVVVGTRPEAVKVAPLILAMDKDPRFECVVCATGQHKEMLYQILDWFGIVPDYKMDVMTHAQPLTKLAGKLLHGLHDIIAEVHPDIVMVQGDTTSAFIASLAAYYNYDIHKQTPIQIAHVEAGLRTGELFAPYPEEGNRVLIGHIADWHFAPTMTAAEALYEENVTKNVFITGNTVIDALMETERLLSEQPRNPLPQIPEGKKIILVTGHRRENYGEGFDNICQALKEISERYPECEIVYPVHLNPYVKEPVTEHLSGLSNIHLIRPMDYPDFVAAMKRSYIILTDSGGVQEEAPSLGKPVLCMRDVTERPEAVSAGVVRMVGTSKEDIVNDVFRLMDDEEFYKQMNQATNPYGDGKACERILNILWGEKGEENTFSFSLDVEKVA